MADSSSYQRLAEETLYVAHEHDEEGEKTAIARGQAWATLALAAAISEAAAALRER